MLSTVPDFGAFKSLGTLYLSDVRFEPNVFESLMLGCPSLVTLDISHCSGLKSINVSSPVLEILNLQGDQATESICLENAKNLTDLALLADRPGDNFERDTISNLIKGLSKIKSICLGEGYFKVSKPQHICFPKRLQGSLNCLKHVELYGVDFTETRELLFVISLLKSSPNIEKLLIEVTRIHLNLLVCFFFSCHILAHSIFFILFFRVIAITWI
uniref:F-box/FBD/LRR-repeat protein At1g13570 family n=1 Tax=Cajanus cajan TaxID=3821 RepID=A0A151SYD7_CAJCA|nr:F-box/FBD/LRR-repeat protein At1g13570 family [Cajanus cajan]